MQQQILKAYTITGSEALTYFQVAEILTEVLGRKITYTNPTMKEFVRQMSSEGYALDMINVMKIICFIAKIGFAAGLTSELKTLLGKDPIIFKQFAIDNQEVWKKEN